MPGRGAGFGIFPHPGAGRLSPVSNTPIPVIMALPAASARLIDEQPPIQHFAMSASLSPVSSVNPFNRLGALGLVLLLHLAFFYALQGGLTQPARSPAPREIIATLIAAQPAAAPAPPAPAPAVQPAPPKPQVAPRPTPQPRPPRPAVTPKPAPQPAPKAITPPAEPAPAPLATETPAAAAPTSSAPAATAPGPAASSASSTPAQPRTVTSGVEYLQPPRPEYPALSRRMGEEGTVMLRILINERGRAERADIHKSSGVPRLDDAARQAALRAVFKPYTENGRPVPVYAILPISFQLDN